MPPGPAAPCFVVQFDTAPSASMQNTFLVGAGLPRPDAEPSGGDLVDRVIALPGDTVKCAADGGFTVNGATVA